VDRGSRREKERARRGEEEDEGETGEETIKGFYNCAFFVSKCVKFAGT